MPSGRDVVEPHPAKPSTLDNDTIAKMRAPLDQEELNRLGSEIEQDSDEDGHEANIPGAFPGSEAGPSSTYY